MDDQFLRRSAPTGVGRAVAARSPGQTEIRTSDLDGLVHAAQGAVSAGLSSTALALAFVDWGVHIADAPFRRLALARQAAIQWSRLAAAAASGEMVIAPSSKDHRFNDPAWRRQPFALVSQAFLLAEEWWAKAAEGPAGVSKANQRIVSFATRQLVDMLSPSNAAPLNPEVIEATAARGGANFADGAVNLFTDLQEALTGHACGPDAFRVGKDLATTPGKVVFRNALIELIQYQPTTAEVGREPVLIVPAWIMKYYILDLSPDNSLIRFLVDRGHTVFAISWRNPDASYRDTSFDDYRTQGILAALAVVGDICPDAKIHACGYCLGGTLLAITAAAMAMAGDDRLASITLFCTETDFTEAGELQLFITEDQLAFLDDLMRVQGYLDSRQMAGAFHLLRSNDLIWSRAIKTYLMGEREHPIDLMAWNADGTRVPARMQAEYLKRLYLDNELAEGRFPVEGRPVSLNDIRCALFAVATETDHIAPWRSVHKIHLLSDADLTFVLTTGGHNAGVVSEPGHHGRRFRIGRRPVGALYVGPDEWLDKAESRDGSWWPAWWSWLDAHSSGRTPPPAVGSPRHPPIDDAPGRYVFEH